jgi:hypothetical protein
MAPEDMVALRYVAGEDESSHVTRNVDPALKTPRRQSEHDVFLKQ